MSQVGCESADAAGRAQGPRPISGCRCWAGHSACAWRWWAGASIRGPHDPGLFEPVSGTDSGRQPVPPTLPHRGGGGHAVSSSRA